MSRALRVAAVIAVVVGSAACGQGGDSTGNLEKRLDALETRLAALVKERASPNAASSSTSPSPSTPQPPTSEAARRAVEALRAQALNLDFTDAHVPIVFKLILEQAGVSFIVSPAASALTATVTLKFSKVNAHDGLQALAAQTPMRWTVDDSGVVRITTVGEN